MGAAQRHLFVVLFLTVGVCGLTACDPTEAQRFRDQEPWYRFDGLVFEVEVRGARLESSDPDVRESFSCPGDDVSPGASVTVLQVDATSPTPTIEVSLDNPGFACADTEPFGVELSGLPIDAIDLYRSCNDSASDRFLNRCPGPIVPGGCSEDAPEDACEVAVRGRYRVVAWSELSDRPGCRDAGVRESPFRDPSTGRRVPEFCAACDQFEPEPPRGMGEGKRTLITVALRGDAPELSADGTASCCEPDATPLHVMCLRACQCRRTFVSLVPKDDVSPQEPFRQPDGVLKLAVLSDVESNKGVFRRFVAQAEEEGVDAILNIGDLTDSGGQSGVRGMAEFVDEQIREIDGDSCTTDDDGRLCCAPGERVVSSVCNATLVEPGFMNGLGRNETDEDSFFTFFNEFGPSNFTTAIGRVQLIVLDSADGTLSSAQFDWLSRALETPAPSDHECEIVGEPPGGEWPLASECMGGSCLEGCGIGFSTLPPLCVPPPRSRSEPESGARNCVCIDARSEVCPGNFVCGDGSTISGQSTCACTRDVDCGEGARCEAGECVAPLRLVFTHTPPFDVFGARNSAFLSRREAARLMAMLADADVDLLFAGSINTFSQVAVAGVRMLAAAAPTWKPSTRPVITGCS